MSTRSLKPRNKPKQSNNFVFDYYRRESKNILYRYFDRFVFIDAATRSTYSKIVGKSYEVGFCNSGEYLLRQVIVQNVIC